MEHPNIAALVADSAEPDDAARTIAKALDSWGRLDVLVNSAGAGAILPLADATAERIASILAVNVLGPSLLAAAALPSLTAMWRIMRKTVALLSISSSRRRHIHAVSSIPTRTCRPSSRASVAACKLPRPPAQTTMVASGATCRTRRTCRGSPGQGPVMTT